MYGSCELVQSQIRRTLSANQCSPRAVQTRLIVMGQHVKLYLVAAFHQVDKAVTNG